MKKIVKSSLIIVGIVAVLIIVVIAWQQFGISGNGSSDSSLTSSTGSSPVVTNTQRSDVADLSDELLALLNSIQSISLNDSIFLNPAFDELRDIGIPINRDVYPGRNNPFSPIGSDVVTEVGVTDGVSVNEIITIPVLETETSFVNDSETAPQGSSS